MASSFRSVASARVILSIVILVLAAGQALAQEHGHLHDLTRARFEATKTSDPLKDGALGDAAVSSDRYDMLSYDLDLRIDPANTGLDGSVKMKFSSLVDGLQEFVFDFTSEDLVIEAVVHQENHLVFAQMPGDSVVVQLPVAMAIGDVDSLIVMYAGQPREPSWDRGLVYRNYSFGGWQAPIVANMSEPAYAKYWWPCKDRPDDKAYTSVRLTVPDTLIGVSNGTLIEEEIPEPGWRSFQWDEAYLMPTYLVSVAVSNYRLLSESCTTDLGSSVPLKNWVFPPDLADAEVEFAPLCDMMNFCEGVFGPYPFLGEKYGHAEFMWSGAMEHTTVTSIGYSSIPGDGTRDWLIVHELGHQWFGDSLTPHKWADIWLNEGFATYTEALWREHLDGRATYLAYLDYWRDEATWAAQGPVYDPVPVFPGRVIYDKGSWILHMLRERMGDASFFALIDEWANGGSRPGGTVITEDFIALAEDFAGEDLQDFFWPYLEETYLPEIAFEYQIIDGPHGEDTEVVVSLRQTSDRIFDNVFPVIVQSEGGREENSIHLSGRTATATLGMGVPIQSVELDPEASVLWLPAGSSGVNQGLMLAYPNPALDGYITLRYKLDQAADVTLKIYNARGLEVARRSLGTVSPEPGYNEVSWDLKDNAEALVASGVYWVTMEVAGQRSVKKVSVVH